MRVLVTGAAGFAGLHLLHELAVNGHETVAFDRAPASVPDTVSFHKGDLCDHKGLVRLLAEVKPDACIHLAALSFVPDGNADPASVFNINVIGTLHLLEAFRTHGPGARILVVSTAHVYGTPAGSVPLTEAAPLAPVTFYAISKACADNLSLAYFRDYGMHVSTARPNNHIGPGQAPRFVIPSLAGQIKAGSGRHVRVGNMDSVRDFSDVRDVVRAYRLILERGQGGKAYNISAQNFQRIGDIADRFCKMAGGGVELRKDPSLFRPTDTSPQLDTKRMETEIGWQPLIPFEQTLRNIWDSL